MYWIFFATLNLNYEGGSEKYWVSNRCIKLKQGYFIQLNVVPILTNHEISFNLCALLKIDSHALFIVYCFILIFLLSFFINTIELYFINMHSTAVIIC